MRLLQFAVSMIVITSTGILLASSKKAYPEERAENVSVVQEGEQGVKRDIIQDIKQKQENIHQDIKSDHKNFKESIDPSDDKARLHRLHMKKKELHHKMMMERKHDDHKLNQDIREKRKSIRGDLRDATREKQKRYHAGPEPVRREHRGIKK